MRLLFGRSLPALVGVAFVAIAGRGPDVHAAIQTLDHVEIDAVVVDDDGRGVEGLPQAAFRVKEDGQTMALDDFEEVGGGGHAAARVIVIVLDDSGVPSNLTARVQDIARRFATRAMPGDRINVIRLNRRGDEAVGDQQVSLSRIADYRAGMTPFFGRETLESALTKVRDLSREFALAEHRRKSIVAIGSPITFDVPEPVEGRESLLWPYWADAVAAASRANVSVSVIDPRGVTGRVRTTSSYGLVQRTGGDTLYNSASFDAAVDRIWRDAGHYYLLGYAPARSSRELHDVEVTVNRPGVHVRARTLRG